MSAKRLILAAVTLAVLLGLYFAIVTHWVYDSGERAGWVQKLSYKGWLCKTWEGELALVSLPGSTPEMFAFTVQETSVAKQISQAMGKRVTLHYEQKVGLPTSCFGQTRFYVNSVVVSDEIPLAAGVMVPAPPASAASR